MYQIMMFDYLWCYCESMSTPRVTLRYAWPMLCKLTTSVRVCDIYYLWVTDSSLIDIISIIVSSTSRYYERGYELSKITHIRRPRKIFDDSSSAVFLKDNAT